VFVDNHSIFDLTDIEEKGRLSWAFHLVNKLHIRTRESFIRRELLFKEGDCHDPFLVEESARLLRGYKFLSEAEAYTIQQESGGPHVVVDTRDEWTTKLDLGVSIDDGFRFETIELTEENFLGRGLELELFLQERREQRDAGVRVRTNRMFGTRTDGRFELGTTRVGRFGTFEVAYPFVGETGRLAAIQSFRRDESLFSYSLARGPYSNVVVPLHADRFALGVATRQGPPADLFMVGLAVTRESVRFPEYPTSVELIRNGDFATREPASDSAAALVNRQVQEAWKTRLNVVFEWRNLHYARRHGLDAIRGIQDVALGTDAAFTIGLNPGQYGSGGVDISDDVYARSYLFGAVQWGDALISGRSLVDGRYVYRGGLFGEGWQDVVGEGDVYMYVQPDFWEDHTFFARVSGAGSARVRFPFQLTLGGREGVRGYESDRFPGGRRLLVSVEDRMRFSWPFPELFDFGVTAFFDAGRMWAGDVPFGEDTDWVSSIGGGLRFGLPAGGRGILRIDLAMPLVESPSLSDVVFRVSLREFLGLLRGFDDEQTLRSRIVGFGSEAFQAGR